MENTGTELTCQYLLDIDEFKVSLSDAALAIATNAVQGEFDSSKIRALGMSFKGKVCSERLSIFSSLMNKAVSSNLVEESCLMPPMCMRLVDTCAECGKLCATLDLNESIKDIHKECLGASGEIPGEERWMFLWYTFSDLPLCELNERMQSDFFTEEGVVPLEAE